MGNTNTSVYQWASNMLLFFHNFYGRSHLRTWQFWSVPWPFSKMWEDLLLLHDKFLSCLAANGFTVKPFKCEWAVQETDWLRYWLTPTSLKPWKNCISAILEQEPPCNLKEMRSFLGVVNAYWLMWHKCVHLLKPLSNEAGKKPFVGPPKWTRLSNLWKQSWLWMSSWQNPTTTCLFTFTWHSQLPNRRCNSLAQTSCCLLV